MERPKREDFKLENYDELYNYYEEYRINPKVSKLFRFALKTIYHPKVSGDPETLELIERNFEFGDPIIMAANHIKFADQFIVGAALPELVGRTFTLAKVPYFKQPLVRDFIEGTGGIPVFRENDMQTGDCRIDLGRAAIRMVHMSSERLGAGENMFVFPEGTRNIGDPTRIQEIKTGIARIACRGRAPIVPIGLAYPDRKFANWVDPSVYIGPAIEPPFGSIIETTDQLAVALQTSVDRANETLS